MPTVRGFKGIRYNPDKIEDFGSVLAPPYDVISPREQEEFHEADPLNVIRLILPKGEGDSKYERSAKVFRDWFLDDTLIQDREPSIYPYYQDFEENGKRYTRKGFIARVKLEDFSTKKILPHEMTFPKHKLDRLKLNTACRANMSPVFSVYSDPEGSIEKMIDERLPEKPLFDIVYKDGIRNRLWKISDAETISSITGKMAEMSFLIADGHHRYETALEYRNIQRGIKDGSGEEPFDYVMMYIARGEGEGLIINPTHRIVKNLGQYTADGFLERLAQEFEVEKMPFRKGIEDIGYEEFTVVTSDAESTYRISSPKAAQPEYARLGVMLLHNIVFKKILNEEESGIFYTKYLDEALGLVRDGEYKLAFILPELRASDIFEVVMTGERMPHKTTYFYPKILSGLTFNPLW
jgi:uncharacterized protein (DUF1015 family)